MNESLVQQLNHLRISLLSLSKKHPPSTPFAPIKSSQVLSLEDQIRLLVVENERLKSSLISLCSSLRSIDFSIFDLTISTLNPSTAQSLNPSTAQPFLQREVDELNRSLSRRRDKMKILKTEFADSTLPSPAKNAPLESLNSALKKQIEALCSRLEQVESEATQKRIECIEKEGEIRSLEAKLCKKGSKSPKTISNIPRLSTPISSNSFSIDERPELDGQGPSLSNVVKKLIEKLDETSLKLARKGQKKAKYKAETIELTTRVNGLRNEKHGLEKELEILRNHSREGPARDTATTRSRGYRGDREGEYREDTSRYREDREGEYREDTHRHRESREYGEQRGTEEEVIELRKMNRRLKDLVLKMKNNLKLLHSENRKLLMNLQDEVGARRNLVEEFGYKVFDIEDKAELILKIGEEIREGKHGK